MPYTVLVNSAREIAVKKLLLTGPTVGLTVAGFGWIERKQNQPPDNDLGAASGGPSLA
jgi:hypothetical protein